MFNAVGIIRKKRDGQELTREEISYFIKSFVNNEIADYQMSALLMAGYCRGMTNRETQALTEEMLYSGDVVDFSYLPEIKIDKHSTGGVGDKTSLVIAPIVAAAGLKVPMISGRGLGHTGGTLDKLESIPGFKTQLTLTEFKQVVEKVGVAIIGQTYQIAPADKKIYSLRDTTATIESIPFITASIMSKKLAEGLDALVLDVKCGNGAFMKTEEDAKALAQSLVETGKRMGKSTAALLTDMNQPLGWAVGNSLEVIESIEALKGSNQSDFVELCLHLSSVMFKLGRLSSSYVEGRELAIKMISSGKALDKFIEFVEAQGGDARIVDDSSLLPRAKHIEEVLAPESGYLSETDTQAIGTSVMHLGAGRRRTDTEIDHSVGVEICVKLGDRVEKGDLLCRVFYNASGFLPELLATLRSAFKISNDQPAELKLVREIIE